MPLRRSSLGNNPVDHSDHTSGSTAIEELGLRTDHLHAAMLLPDASTASLSRRLQAIERDRRRIRRVVNEAGPSTARSTMGFGRTPSDPPGHHHLMSMGRPVVVRRPEQDAGRAGVELDLHIEQVRKVLEERIESLEQVEVPLGSPPSYAETMRPTSTEHEGERIAFRSMSSVWSTSTGETPQRSDLHDLHYLSQVATDILPGRQSSLHDLLVRLDQRPGSPMSDSTAPSLPMPAFEPTSLCPWERSDFFPPAPPLERARSESRPPERPLTLGRRRIALEVAIPPRRSTGAGVPSARKLLSDESLETARMDRSQVMMIKGPRPG